MKGKEYEKAIESYSAGIEITPNNYYLYSNRSQAYINLKKYEDGRADAEKTIELNPEWFKGYSHKSTALARLGRWTEVIQIAEVGLTKVTEDRDAGVLRQNIMLAKAGLFETAILGAWVGRVSDAMGGYRQTIEFNRKGELSVSIMHRRQDCKYTVRPLDNPDLFTVYFTLPYAETRTPYLARLVPGDKAASGEDELLLCCNADVAKSGETPRETDLEERGDGFVLMTRYTEPKQDEEFKRKPLSNRLFIFADKYWDILERRNTSDWSEKNPAEPGVMIQALKFQSEIFDLEESVGKEVVDAFFLIAAGVDGAESSIPMQISEETRSAVIKVKDALMAKKMLDEALLQQKKDVYLQFLALEAQQKKEGSSDASKTPDAEPSTSEMLDIITRYPISSLGIAGAVLVVGALAIGYLSRRKN